MNEPLDDLRELKRQRPQLKLSVESKQLMVGACLLSWGMTGFAVFQIESIVVSGPIALVIGLLVLLWAKKGEWIRYVALSWLLMVIGGYLTIQLLEWGPPEAAIPIAAAMGGYCVLLSLVVASRLRRSRLR